MAFKTRMEMVSSDKILAEDYQRGRLDMGRVKRIVDAFDENLVNPIKVGYQNGRYYVFDGQHTLRALIMRNGGKPLMVKCKVFLGTTYADRAMLFAQQNGIAQPVNTNQKLRARYLAGDKEVIALADAVNASGFSCKFNMANNFSEVRCYTCLQKIFSLYGAKHLTATLSVINAAWGKVEKATDMHIITGVSLFLRTYPDMDTQTALKKWSTVTPVTVLRMAQSRREGSILADHVGWDKAVATVLYDLYNKRTRAKLPNRFWG